MSVGKAKVSEWLSRTVKEEKDRRNKRIFDLWLACHTQEEISAEVKLAQKQISNVCESFSSLVPENQITKTLSFHAEPGFKPPIYKIGKHIVEYIAEVLSVTDRTVREWLKGDIALDKFSKQVKALAMWLAGKTEREIAEELKITHETISSYLVKNGNISEIHQIFIQEDPDKETKQKQDVIGALTLEAYARLGEMIKGIDKKASYTGFQQRNPVLPEGITWKESHRARKIAERTPYPGPRTANY